MSKVTGGMLKLVTSQGLTVAIAFLTAPIIARLFSPHDFGVNGIIDAIVYWAAAFCCLGYSQALPLSARKEETSALLKLCLLITVVLTAVVTAAVYFIQDYLPAVFGDNTIASFIWFVPLLFFLMSLNSIRRYLLAKDGQFGLLALSNFATPNLSRVVQIVLGSLFGGSAGFLLLGSTVGAVAGIVIGTLSILALLFHKGPKEPMLAVAKKHSQFPRFQIWTSCIQTGSTSVPVFFLGWLFELAIVGQYSFARKVLELPLQVMGAAVGQAFYPELANEWNEKGTVSISLQKATRLLIVTCTFPLVVVGVLGPMVFEVLFGPQWKLAGIYSQILAPWFMCHVVASPISTVFFVHKRMADLLLFAVACLVARCGAVWIGSAVDSDLVAIGMLSAVGTLLYGLQIGRTMKLGGLNVMWPFKLLLPELIRSALFLWPSAIAYYVFSLPLVSAGLLAAGGIVFCFDLFRRHPVVAERLWAKFRRSPAARAKEQCSEAESTDANEPSEQELSQR